MTIHLGVRRGIYTALNVSLTAALLLPSDNIAFLWNLCSAWFVIESVMNTRTIKENPETTMASGFSFIFQWV